MYFGVIGGGCGKRVESRILWKPCSHTPKILQFCINNSIYNKIIVQSNIKRTYICTTVRLCFQGSAKYFNIKIYFHFNVSGRSLTFTWFQMTRQMPWLTS